MAKVREGYVVVVGCGGVGSWCALMLLRRSAYIEYIRIGLELTSSGVSKLLLIDVSCCPLSTPQLTTVRFDHPVLPQPSLLRYAGRRRNAKSRGHAEVPEEDRTMGAVSVTPLTGLELDSRIDIHVGLWRKGEGDRLLEGADWVVDAIDNIDTKVDLLTYCAKNKIKVFSSMGSGAKRDPTRIQMA